MTRPTLRHGTEVVRVTLSREQAAAVLRAAAYCIADAGRGIAAFAGDRAALMRAYEGCEKLRLAAFEKQALTDYGKVRQIRRG